LRDVVSVVATPKVQRLRFYEALVRGVCELSERLGIVRAFTGSLAVVGICPRGAAEPSQQPAQPGE
jgi:hypothetical protein